MIIGRVHITHDYRSKSNDINPWGRFGGGWDWKLGFQAGGSTVIFSLLIFSVRISLQRKSSLEDTQ